MRRVLVALVVVLAAGALVGASAPGAEPPLQPIARGVVISGIHVGGLSSERARVRIDRNFLRPLDLRIGSHRWLMSPRHLGAKAAVDEAVTSSLRAKPYERLLIPARVSNRAVKRYVDYLAKRSDLPATDARLTGVVGNRPAIEGGKTGRVLDRAAAAYAVRWELRHGRRAPLRLPVKKIEPRVTAADIGPVVVIERAANRLTLYDGNKVVHTFGVATGQSIYPTPAGNWHVVTKQRDPWWYPPNSPWAVGAKPIPPGPGNPLGTRWMGLDAPGVGMHGTPDDASIGYSASHGCIRMHIPDAEWLFEHVHIGTPVFIL